MWDVNSASSQTRFFLRVCARCGTGVTDVPPGTAVDLKALYPLSYGSFDRLGNAGIDRLAQFSRKVEILATGSAAYGRLVEPGFQVEQLKGLRILEIGCGSGRFLQVLKEHGALVYGVEPNTVAARIARQAGLEVLRANFEDAELPPESFDRIYLIHALEHMRDPIQCLEKCSTLLRVGGTIVAAVPNYDSPPSRFFRDAWFSLEIPRHWSHFSPDGIRSLFARVGYRELSVEYESSLEDVVPSLVNLMRTRKLRFHPIPSRRRSDRHRIERLALERGTAMLLSLVVGPVLSIARSSSRRCLVIRGTKIQSVDSSR